MISKKIFSLGKATMEQRKETVEESKQQKSYIVENRSTRRTNTRGVSKIMPFDLPLVKIVEILTETTVTR